MPAAAKRTAVYEDLVHVPENMVGEIINGQLVATPRPSRRHGLTATALSGKLTPPYYFGEGNGPGGWVFIMEPEVSFGTDILVPDLAGWKEDRYLEDEPHNWISAVPDWICEVISPSTQQRDKMEKMPIYARHGLPYLWLIDPMARTLDAFRLEGCRWVVVGLFVESARVRVEPFVEVEIDLNDLWLRPGSRIVIPPSGG